ncbi:kinase-like domain-containing protein [Lasiosphaeria miniovina]|uniref:Kinase-like domain-containing protein n=1 Tax=Lasiosphaeria miniovina TaxID=1954250 RepID=A0AA40AVE0_9PEZI|nr:kinase-like domain-containing protein [Lasiosphaeria miniovina]KAK0722664.1 kinase-like domain-containing protein [Lasiosphaeria miniovina]
MSQDELSLRFSAATASKRPISQRATPAPVPDFASFLVAFIDIFMSDGFYTDFGAADDMVCVKVMGSDALFETKLVEPRWEIILRSQHVVLRRPNLAIDAATKRSVDPKLVKAIVTDLRVMYHPALRHHPNILAVHGCAWLSEPRLLVISACPAILPLDLDAKLRLAGGIARGVSALHACRIVHWDLGPENVLVTRGQDGKLTAKLASFAMSLVLDEGWSPEPWAGGTRHWMAPEWGTAGTDEELYSTDESSSVGIERAGEIRALLQSLLGPANKRSLDLLLRSQAND